MAESQFDGPEGRGEDDRTLTGKVGDSVDIGLRYGSDFLSAAGNFVGGGLKSAVNAFSAFANPKNTERSPTPLSPRYAAKLIGPAAREDFLPTTNHQATLPQRQHAFFARFVFRDAQTAEKVASQLKLFGMNGLNNKDNSIYAMMKTIDAPSFKIETETLMAYNKPRTIAKKIEFDSLSVSFHDMINQETRNFWRIIYSHYFSNGFNKTIGSGADERVLPWQDSVIGGPTRGNENVREFGYTLENKIFEANLFDRIEFYSLYGGIGNMIAIMNPVIESMDHGQFNYDSNEFAELKMSFVYDNVIYLNNPAHVGEISYDVFNGLNEGMGEGMSKYARHIRSSAISKRAFDAPDIVKNDPLSQIKSLKDTVQKGFSTVHELGNKVLQVGSRVNAAFGVFGVGIDLTGLQKTQQKLRNVASTTNSVFGAGEFVAGLPGEISGAINNFKSNTAEITEEDALAAKMSTPTAPNKVGVVAATPYQFDEVE